MPYDEDGGPGKKNPTEIHGCSSDWKQLETSKQQRRLAECGKNLRDLEEKQTDIWRTPEYNG